MLFIFMLKLWTTTTTTDDDWASFTFQLNCYPFFVLCVYIFSQCYSNNDTLPLSLSLSLPLSFCYLRKTASNVSDLILTNLIWRVTLLSETIYLTTVPYQHLMRRLLFFFCVLKKKLFLRWKFSFLEIIICPDAGTLTNNCCTHKNHFDCLKEK